MNTQLNARSLIQSAFVLASTASFAAFASPDGGAVGVHRSIMQQHIEAHNEQGDVSPMSSQRQPCGPDAPWFTGIGQLPQGWGSDALGVSPDGNVIVGSATGIDENSGSGAYYHGIAWNTCTGLRTLPGTPIQATWSSARSISDTGRHVAGAVGLEFDSGAMWLNTTDGIERLWNPNAQAFQSTAVVGVSADGTAFAGTAQDELGSEAFFYTLGASEATMLGDLPGGLAASQANAVSHNANAVVGWSGSANGTEAFRWTPGQGMQALGDLPGGGFDSSAMAVSADGSVVVGYATDDTGHTAFRWTAQTGMVSLGHLANGDYASEALGVSADGDVIVGRVATVNGDEAFIWTPAAGMRTIRDVALTQLPQEFAFWQIAAARGISADGTVIVGSGVNPDGMQEGWVLDLPRGCRADWNRDGELNSADFFLFMTSFFSGSADFTGDGQTNTQDYFEFVTLFFAGC